MKQTNLFKDDYELTTHGYGPAPTGAATYYQIPDEAAYWRRNRVETILRLYTRAYWSSPASVWCRVNLPRGTFEVYFANDTDTVGLALWLRPRCRVHVDLHEYSPREKEDVWQQQVFVKPHMEWQARHFAARADSVTSTATKFCGEYQRSSGVDAGLVANASPCADLNLTPLLEPGQPLRLVHVGAGHEDCYLETMIDSVVVLLGHYILDMYLTANNAAYVAQPGEYAARTPNVWVLPGVPYHELTPTSNRHDLGIHNFPPVNFNNRYVLPNKFFDFAQARLGMVVGPSPEVVPRLDKYRLGRVATDFTARTLRVVLEQTIREEVWQWKQNAAAYAREISSETTVGTWCDAVAAIVTIDPSAPWAVHGKTSDVNPKGGDGANGEKPAGTAPQ